MVWLKIRENDINASNWFCDKSVVVWLKIRENDIPEGEIFIIIMLWFD